MWLFAIPPQPMTPILMRSLAPMMRVVVLAGMVAQPTTESAAVAPATSLMKFRLVISFSCMAPPRILPFISNSLYRRTAVRLYMPPR